MEKITVNSDCAAKRLDVFLSEILKISRAAAAKLTEDGKVLINGVPKKSSYKLRIADVIEYDKNLLSQCNQTPEPQDIKLDIKFEDEHLLVINKPKGMLSHPSAYQDKNTLVNALLHHCGDNLSNKEEPFRRGIVHRLDKNTSGLMLAAKTDAAHKSLQEQIRNKTAIRKYLAVALGQFDTECGKIDAPLVYYMGESVKMQVANAGTGKDALTYYKVLKRFEFSALIELELKTGRTHQIRAHMASIGHPLFGDTLYGAKGKTVPKYRGIKTNEQVLMSYYLCFTHPNNNEIMEFELAPDEWDEDLKKVLRFLGDRE